MNAKRFWISLILGIIAGFICAYGGNDQTPEDVRPMWFVTVVLNRALIGFIIGISSWRIPWHLHGILIGAIGSLPISLPFLVNPDGGLAPCLIYIIAGIVWGFLIELTTSKVFKAPMNELSS